MVYHRDERGVQGGPDDRVFFWYSPPEKFMPLQHTREELAAFGLPPVPDATLTPEAHDFWEELYSGDLTWAWAMGAGGVAVQSLRPSQLRSSVGESLYESSANWYGLYITPRDGEMVTEMHGTWTVTE